MTDPLPFGPKTQRRLNQFKPNETQWSNQVKVYARTGGWLAHHQRPGLERSGKWSSAIEGDKGYPDWTFVHPARRLMFVAELKGYDARGRLGKPTDEQLGWLAGFRRAGVFAAVWGPDDETEVVAVLVHHRIPSVDV